MTRSRATAVSGALLLLTLACSKSETPSTPKEAPATQAAAPATPPPPPAPPAPAPGDLPGPSRREGAARRRREDPERPRLQGAAARHGQGQARRRRTRSRSTTRAGPPTATCSTARSSAASRRASRVGGVIKGWTEGLQLMVVGEKRRFWIPADLAYGESPGGGRPSGMLVFDVELLGITSPPKAARGRRRARPRTPRRPSRASPTACSRRAPARSTRRPSNTVEVHYSGWTTDGKMFDSSVARGQPATLPAERRDPGLDRGRAADGRRREDPLLDPGQPRLRQLARAPARPRGRWCSTSSCSASSSAWRSRRARTRSSAAPASSRRCWRRAVRTGTPGWRW